MDPRCQSIRANILKASHSSGHGHIPTSFSIIECLVAVYEVMRHDPKRPDWPERDKFVLSKGHASLGYYGVLSSFGYFPAEDMLTFGGFMSNYGCHADRLKARGVEASTGSLGHGIGIATGMALGSKIHGSKSRVFTLIGDGESNEGTVWEAVMVANNNNLNNLTIIYDHNKSQGRCMPLDKPVERFSSFGCDVEMIDGHDLPALRTALARQSDRVRVIVADSVKGYGCRTLVDNMYEWHRRSPNAEELGKLMEELHAPAV